MSTAASIENRARYPLELFRAIRAVWPEDKPMSVRLSCHRLGRGRQHARGRAGVCEAVQGGRRRPDRLLVRPGLGRRPSGLRPARTRRRSPTRSATRLGVATIAVGAISEADHANSIIAAGRADLCAIARPHLADPAWTLHEAAKIGVKQIAWPKQYVSGKSQYEANLERAAAGGEGMTRFWAQRKRAGDRCRFRHRRRHGDRARKRAACASASPGAGSMR